MILRSSVRIGSIELAWGLSMLGALLVFQQSMARCRVRLIHVMRVWTYGVLLPLIFLPVVIGFAMGMEALGVDLPNEDTLILIGCGSFMLFTGRSLHLGYNTYLRMPHTLAIAVSAHIIALLVALILLVDM